jgi:integrase
VLGVPVTIEPIAAITGAAGMDDHVTSHVLRHTFGTVAAAASTS